MNFLKTKKLFKKYSIELIGIIIGTILMSIGVSQFLLPNQLSSGGFSGIATITYYLLKWPMGRTIILLNIPCFIMAFIRIGKEFVFKSLIGTVFLSFFIDFFAKYQELTNDRVLACIYGGVIVGIGTALILRSNGSTGGSDLISLLAKSYNIKLSTSNIIVIFDVVVIALNVIAFKELEIGLYSAIAILIMGKMIDIIFEGIGFSKMIFIISDKYEEISERICEIIKRGTTGIYAKGMYTNKEKMMIMCIASRGEVIKIRQIANQIDKSSFTVITNVREVYGKGFKRLNS